jgi:Type IV secretion-system coupling protein DNA-binding domain
MGDWGMSMSEGNMITGIIVKILKFSLGISIFIQMLIQIHLVYFGILNIFIDSLDFEMMPLKAPYIGAVYNNFCFIVSGMVFKMNAITSFLMIIFILALFYVAYYHTKNKRFPRVIIGTIFNNLIILISIGATCAIASNFTNQSEIVFVILGLLLICYAVFLLFFKNRSKSLKTKFFDKVKNKKSEITNQDSFVFETKSGKINLLNPYRGIYIQGGAGSGKSASIFEPIIKQIGEKQFAGILYDFKSPKLTNLIFSSYANGNIKVKNVDFKEALLSDRVNPINPTYLSKSVIANEYAQVILNNLLPESIKKPDFWISNAKMILAGVIWYLRKKHPKYCTLPHAISLILHSSIDVLIAKISEDYEAGGMVASLRESIERGADRTVAGMLATLQNALSSLNSQDIFWILSSNDVDLHLNNKENATFLCLGNDSTLPTTYTPAISLIISVALRQMNQPDQQKSVVLLDEAPTVFIPNIEQIPATARSNKIATVFGVQDMAQLQDKYGQDKAQVIISNLGNQFFGRVTNGKTAEMVSNLFGKADKTFISKTEGDGTSGQFIHLGSNNNQGTNENIQERDRVKPNDLINLSQGEFYGIIAEGTPREFLKTQFNRAEIVNTYINTKIPVTEKILEENYFRIIEECKTIIE